MEKENKSGLSEFKKPSFVFPTEFPYEFDSFGCSSASLSSPDESVISSTETESSDEDDFLAGLTRRLTQELAVKPEKKWVMAQSPESTLSGKGSWSLTSNGSPNGVLSPPTTPFEVKNDTWDLIYAAYSQVARLQTSNEDDKSNTFKGSGSPFPCMTQNQEPQLRNQKNTALYSGHNFGHSMSQMNLYHCPVRQEHMLNQQYPAVCRRQQPVKIPYQARPIQDHQHQHQPIQSRGRSVFGCENGARCVRPWGLSQSAWPPPQVQSNQHQNHQQNQYPHHSGPAMRAGLLGGSSVPKKECAGTGVFLPRRYGGGGSNNHPSDSKRKTACPTVHPVLLPAKAVQSLNLNFEDMNRMNGRLQPRLNSDFASDYGVLMARRNYAILAQQKRNLSLNHEVQLPQEWTY